MVGHDIRGRSDPSHLSEERRPILHLRPVPGSSHSYLAPNITIDKPYNQKNSDNRVILTKMLERFDPEIGRILKAFDDQQLADNTVAILTSDNGGAQKMAQNLPLSGVKQMLMEGGIRVPLTLRRPDVLPKSTTFSTPITAMDLTATIAAAEHTGPDPLCRLTASI